MKKKRRKFTDGFKEEAVKLVLEQGYPITEAARNLDIHANLPGRWKREHEDGNEGRSDTGSVVAMKAELIVPAKVDSILVRYASRSYFAELMHAGVKIQKFEGGLLHTKSITVDGAITMFGTVNLDMRSLWLNYEVTLFVYDEGWGNTIRDLQLGYLQQCRQVDRNLWLERSPLIRFTENLANLMSPLL